MASFVQTDVGLYWGAYSLASNFNAVALNLTNGTVEDTTYGDTFVSHAGGLSSVQVEGEGYWDSTNDSVLETSLGVENTVMTVTPVDQVAASPAIFTNLTTSEYAPFTTGTVGEMLAFRVSGEGRGSEVVNGTIFISPSTTRDDSVNSGVQNLGAISATQSVYSALHVVTVAGSSPTLDVVVKSSASSGFGSSTSRITHTQATGVTSELKSTAGAITDAYWRVDCAIGGTSEEFDFIVSVGIK